MERIVFLDRDGTLNEEVHDEQVDSLAKVRLMPGVISALLALKQAGYRFVVVTNQDGLGTPRFPRPAFQNAHDFILHLFNSQGIEFEAVLICPHYLTEQCHCRKPKLGMLQEFLRNRSIDKPNSYMVGDRDTDLEFASNLGVTGIRIRLNGSEAESWPQIAARILAHSRRAELTRRTKETEVRVLVDLSDTEGTRITTGLGFFDHMLEQIARHGGFALQVECRGDLHIDEHHTVEDVALTVGSALKQALGDKRGIGRYGFLLAMDEAEAQVALDISGRPYFQFEGKFNRERVGELPTELVPHFFRSLAESLGAALHLKVQGENTHHMIEACFKGVGRALRQAVCLEGNALPSTKGVL